MIFSKVLAEISSPLHGTIYVRERFGRKEIVTRDSSGNEFSQSGPLVAQIWSSVLKDQVSSYARPNILIMGLGGGTLVDMIATYRASSKIDVVEIDPCMLSIATQYFDFNSLEATVYVDSAETFVQFPKEGAYDLICVDLYCHSAVPKFTEGDEWLREVGRILRPNGKAIFNRLAFNGFREPSELFLNKVKTVFTDIEVVKKPSPFFASNMLIVCSC